VDLGECQSASIHAVAQKVYSQVNSLFHQVPRTAVCTVFPAPRAAWDALAGRDVALRLSAGRFPALFQAPVRGCPWATVETARSDAPRTRRVPQPQDGQKKVDCQPEQPAVVQKVLLDGTHQAQMRAVPLLTPDESEWPTEVSLQTVLQGQPVSRLAVQPQAYQMEPEPELSERQAQLLAP
jgi:hypothetical protein